MPIQIIIRYVQYICQKSLFQAKDSPVSRDHSNSNCYWLFIFMLKIVKKNVGIAKKMF